MFSHVLPSCGVQLPVYSRETPGHTGGSVAHKPVVPSKAGCAPGSPRRVRRLGMRVPGGKTVLLLWETVMGLRLLLIVQWWLHPNPSA